MSRQKEGKLRILWEHIKEKILKRDKWHCLRCGNDKKYNLTVHHIKPRNVGGDNSEENLITLCVKCHDWVELNLEFEPILKTRNGIINSFPFVTQRRDPLYDSTFPQSGDKLPGDKIDIRRRWIEQGRTGAKELVETYGTEFSSIEERRAVLRTVDNIK